ncbi:hypothetical protein BpHYR1_021363 [Brachionus plicatilis]|uniref:Uncharacterized protein n=1 Tax=Brachionus plicatilis TaxID=10195 RepID=A0A3M7Q848_BRAPC|nr:hypothetical protein BpHYR1_021363 [Brachionus plicatilis]
MIKIRKEFFFMRQKIVIERFLEKNKYKMCRRAKNLILCHDWTRNLNLIEQFLPQSFVQLFLLLKPSSQMYQINTTLSQVLCAHFQAVSQLLGQTKSNGHFTRLYQLIESLRERLRLGAKLMHRTNAYILHILLYLLDKLENFCLLLYEHYLTAFIHFTQVLFIFSAQIHSVNSLVYIVDHQMNIATLGARLLHCLHQVLQHLFGTLTIVVDLRMQRVVLGVAGILLDSQHQLIHRLDDSLGLLEINELFLGVDGHFGRGPDHIHHQALEVLGELGDQMG